MSVNKQAVSIIFSVIQSGNCVLLSVCCPRVWFPIECHKIKTKAITATNHKSSVNQSEFAVITHNWCQAWENAHMQLAIIFTFGFASHWLCECEFCQPNTERSKATPKQTQITYSCN